MLIPKYREPRLPKYDLKAGRQIFDKEHTRDEKQVAFISKDAENPIDIRLRQMVLSSLDGQIDIRREFIDKWVALEKGSVIIIGRIADLYLPTRDIRIRDRKGKDIISSFDDVIEYSDREIC